MDVSFVYHMTIQNIMDVNKKKIEQMKQMKSEIHDEKKDLLAVFGKKVFYFHLR